MAFREDALMGYAERAKGDRVATIEVTIKYDTETGSVSVTGPLGQQILMLGLLEAAKANVLAPGPQEDEKLVKSVLAMPPRLVS